MRATVSTGAAHLGRRLAVVAVAVVTGLGAGLGAASASAATAAAPAATAPATRAVAAPLAPTVVILGITPQIAVPVKDGEKATITVRIANPTAVPVSRLLLQVHRGDPITSELGVATAIATPPPTGDVQIAAIPMAGSLAPGASRTVALAVTAGYGPANALCLACGQDGVFPVSVSLSSAATGVEYSRAHTLVPAFAAAPQPVRVSWLWPLIDVPHRGTSATVFNDDNLARSVSAGGRLDRALRVAELVKGKVRLTLVIDPELLDSLTVMSHGYTVRTTTTESAGTGKAAAAAWLKRLHAVSAYDDVSLTGYADPDVDALVRRNVGYSTALSPQVEQRVTSVLGARLTTDVAWPPGENLTSAGLDAVVSTGASTVLLSDDALPGADRDAATPDALSPLPAATGTADALVLSSALQPTVLSATGPDPGVDSTTDLLADLAVRAVANPSVSHYAVLAPTRYVDPQPARAAATMLAVVDAPWAQDLSVAAALTSVEPVDRGPLQPAIASAEIDTQQIRTMTTARDQVAAFRDCLTNQSAPTLLGGYAGGLARATSAAWRLRPAAGQAFTSAILAQITRLEGRVSILAPPGTHYTLSSGAPLEVTVRNNLTVAVKIRIRVAALEGEQGFRANTLPLQTIAAGAQQQIKVPVHVERSGYFRIRITLLTPHNLQLQTSRTISVNSTALGAVALWITGVALGVLVLALVIRVVRRIAGRGRTKPGTSAGSGTTAGPDGSDGSDGSAAPGSGGPGSGGLGAGAPGSGRTVDPRASGATATPGLSQ